jgi:hypothetical protein
MKKLTLLIVLVLIDAFFIGCQTDSQVVSSNLSKAADMFEINRRIVFYNGITDKYILSIEGRCSIEFKTIKFVVTCKTGPSEYKKHYLGKADNVFPFVEQLEGQNVSVYQYRVIFKPESIIPNIDLETSLE